MAVDMESCSIAQTCHIYNTPFVSFRIISADGYVKEWNINKEPVVLGVAKM